jgi:hypothetical protein
LLKVLRRKAAYPFLVFQRRPIFFIGDGVFSGEASLPQMKIDDGWKVACARIETS